MDTFLIDLADVGGDVPGFRFDGPANWSRAGYSIDGGEDVNGDGIDDILIGAPGATGTKGNAYVIYGRGGEEPVADTATVTITITIEGTDSRDRIVGTREGERLSGGSFSDTLIGAGGADSLYGGKGADNLAGGTGRDLILGGTGNDTIKGGAGADSFIFEPGGGADTILDFEPGVDTVTGDIGARGFDADGDETQESTRLQIGTDINDFVIVLDVVFTEF